MKDLIFLLATSLLFTAAAFAQGSISGTITDAKGKPVAGAVLKLSPTDSKNAPATTDASGEYVFDEIAPGKYGLAVIAKGFDVVTKGDIVVTDEEDTTVDLTLVKSPVTTVTTVPPVPKGYLPRMTALLAEVNRRDADHRELAKKFAQLGDEEKAEWLPYYYAALNLNALAMDAVVTTQSGSTDDLANEGLALLDKAEARSKDNSEIYVLRSIFMTTQTMVNPHGRFETYGKSAGEYLETAKKLAPENPRVYAVICSSTLGAPEQFGGGKAKAMPICRDALKKFDAFKPQNSFSPNWGRESVVQILSMGQ